MDTTTTAWKSRVWGVALLLPILSVLTYRNQHAIGISIMALSALVAWDAYRRSNPIYLHPWLFFLLGVDVAAWQFISPAPLATAAGVVAMAMLIIMLVPYRLPSPALSKRHILAALVFTEALAIALSINGTPVIQASVAVVMLLLVEELFFHPGASWWKQALPFGILTLILFLALGIRAFYAFP